MLLFDLHIIFFCNYLDTYELSCTCHYQDRWDKLAF